MEIILIRHGKPTGAINPCVDAIGYTQWVSDYNRSVVSSTSHPKVINQAYCDFYHIASDYPRAIHSAKLYTKKCPDYIDNIYREMDIPYYTFPFKLRAWTWLYVSRFLWMIGFKGNFESFKEAKRRAFQATEQLIKIAEKEERVVLFGHGFMNLHIRKVLVNKGWQLVSKNNDYWGESKLIFF